MKKAIIMPKIGLDMEEGVILEWFKREGEHVKEGEPLLKIETDKTMVDVESSVSGTIVQIICREDETVEITKVIAWIEEDE